MNKKINTIVYIIFGIGGILIGMLGLLAPMNLIPAMSIDAPAEELHLTQELGCAIIFVGLVSLWCAQNYSQSRKIHYLLIVFFALMGLVHWLEYFGGNRTIMSPLINSVPVILLLLMIWIDPVAPPARERLRRDTQ